MASTTETAAKYDLTDTVCRYLDQHMMLPLLEFLSSTNMYEEKDLMQAKLDLLSKTNMVDFAASTYCDVNELEEIPEEWSDRREAVVSQLQELQAEANDLIELIQNPEVAAQLKDDKEQNIKFLKENYQFNSDMVTSLYKYAKFQYECGIYHAAADMLYHVQLLTMDDEQHLSALWGKLSAETLTQNWDSALEDLNRLKEVIDSMKFNTSLDLLQQRVWLLHWSLFCSFNHPKGRTALLDLFLQPAYANAMQTACPHLLRYLATAVITNTKDRRSYMKELVKMIKLSNYEYSDPITEFVQCLYVNFDFDGAQTMLQRCEAILAHDFFLVSLRDDFIEAARRFIFETYCRIHQCIDIRGLSRKLNMAEEEGEKWIVDLIRSARLDAKIDLAENTIVMGTQQQSIHQQVIEKSRNLTFRANMLSSNMYKLLQHKANPHAAAAANTLGGAGARGGKPGSEAGMAAGKKGGGKGKGYKNVAAVMQAAH